MLSDVLCLLTRNLSAYVRVQIEAQAYMSTRKHTECRVFSDLCVSMRIQSQAHTLQRRLEDQSSFCHDTVEDRLNFGAEAVQAAA